MTAAHADRTEAASDPSPPGWRIGSGSAAYVLVLITIASSGSASEPSCTRNTSSSKTAAERDSANLTRGFDETIERGIDATDEMLLFIREGYRRDPAGFDLAAWARAGHLFSGPVAGIALLGPDGGVLQASPSPSAPTDGASSRPNATPPGTGCSSPSRCPGRRPLAGC